ncbi:integrase/recombinase, phage integrase family [Streptococcus pneumoniae]|nr:integrase/recombinase, phage integrase family [Streptococcus pneumoniae]
MKDFELHLKKAGLAENTVRSYLYGVRFFLENYELKMEDLFEYKGYLLDNFKPKTVNLRLQGVNKYLAFIGHDDLKLKFVKVQQKPFLEDVISHADYLFLKRSLKKDGILKWHFVVWFLGATGARVSELIKLKVEHVEIGYFDIYSKGGKIRRLYIPKKLRNSCLSWLESENRRSGYLFLNKFNEPITARGVAQQLKNYADKYKMNPKVIYPHSFRHLFAKNFLAKYNDIALLADLMGHESIETTRIYLRKTATEQQNIIKIKDIFSINTGLSYKKGDLSINNKGVRIIRGGNIKPLEFSLLDNDYYIDTQFISSEQVYLKHNQLITPVSTSLEHIGKFARIDKDYDGVVAGGFIFQLTPFESSEIISKFLLFNLSSPLFYKQLKAITKLSGQALYNIPKTTLSELLIPLAPFEEQELITQKVEKLFEKVNQLWK